MLIVALLLVLRQNRSETGGEPMRRVDVLIDPGHGGPDAGAQGPDASERDVVLELAASLDRLLKRQGLTTRLTRTSNTTPEPSFAARTRPRARVMVSLHMDCWMLGGKPCYGWWVFWGGQPNSEKFAQHVAAALVPLAELAPRVENHLSKLWKNGKRGLYIADFQPGPSVLVELGRVRRLSQLELDKLSAALVTPILAAVQRQNG